MEFSLVKVEISLQDKQSNFVHVVSDTELLDYIQRINDNQGDVIVINSIVTFPVTKVLQECTDYVLGGVKYRTGKYSSQGNKISYRKVSKDSDRCIGLVNHVYINGMDSGGNQVFPLDYLKLL
jgi:hypothetical protein